ncbi:MAG: sugar transferase [Chloroflexi bacterium]|nr:sugar transferase [Chloroflexota bacterium]
MGASISLILFGLALPFIALAVRLDSPGPIFYRQDRVGKGGKVFKVLKLRTVVADAERNGAAVWAGKNDPRVTRLGRILRKTRLDELPQFLNILRGEMSAASGLRSTGAGARGSEHPGTSALPHLRTPAQKAPRGQTGHGRLGDAPPGLRRHGGGCPDPPPV